MKAITLFCYGFVPLAFCSEVLATPADDTPPLPRGPLLQRIAGYSAVQITYSYSGDQTNSGSGADTTVHSPPPAPTLFPTSPIRQLTLTRTKPLWHAVRLDVYGNTVEEWYTGTDRFYTAPGIPEPLLDNPSAAAETAYHKGVSDSGNSTTFPDFNRFDFPDMEWVSAQTYTGVEVVSGDKCLVFKKDGQTAWIDLESRFPIKWQRGGETRTFQMLSPPIQPLVLPPKVARIAAAMKHDRDKWANLVPSNQK